MSSEFEKSFDRAGLLRRGVAAGGSLAVAGMLPQLASARRESTTLNLVAYSTPKPVMAALITAFQATPQGQGVSFTQSYGPSTSQAQAVAAGQPCDIIFPSWPGDVQILVDAGLVNKNWNEQSYHGVVANTVVAFAIRHYNPKHIKGWDDLIKSGVQVITPDPFSSGSAKWNVLAAYSAQRHLGKTDAQAQAYVKALFKNVVAQPTSGSAGTAAFLAGEGDVFITYESEAIAATLKGTQVEYVIPRQTLLIQLPIAVMQNSPNKDVANQFIQFLKSTPSQEVFGKNGFRPVNPAAAKLFTNFPVRPGQITLADKTLGGYAAAQQKWFAQPNGLMYGIESADGGPSS
jgi:sulfate/thiosulfate transport system substrate-binding protein